MHTWMSSEIPLTFVVQGEILFHFLSLPIQIKFIKIDDIKTNLVITNDETYSSK